MTATTRTISLLLPRRRWAARIAGTLTALALLSLAPALDAWPDAGPARGPLRAHPKNPRYFTDGTKTPDGSFRVVYLTGAHTWNNLVDMVREESPHPFDFEAYLDFLERHGHNFIRLWAWDSTVWDTRANGRLGKEEFVHRVAPLPWARTGPGKALDGRPRFDLEEFDPEYFGRLRTRVSAAGKRGIYVSVMLFEGWGLMHGNRGRRGASDGWAWRGHPFHRENNINGVDAGTPGDPLSGNVHRLGDRRVNEIQAAYIRKVVDTVGDLENVLYEVINEGGEPEWDWWVVKAVRESERARPLQHAIGITGHGAERLDSMLASPADWISPGRRDGFNENPLAWDGRKVSLLDTDHVWGVGGNPAWVWKSFVRGHNPLFMDPYDGRVLGTPEDSRWEPIRRAMGHARSLAGELDLAAATPRDELASTRFCLAQPGRTYVVYVPDGKEATVDLSGESGSFAVQWIDPVEGRRVEGEAASGGAKRSFRSPLRGDAVLYLRSR